MATNFAGRITTTANSWTDIFSATGVSVPGRYEVQVIPSGSSTYLTSDNSATVGVDMSSNIIAGSGAGTGNGFKFTWDSNIPLYFYRATGTNGTMDLVITPATSVGLSVSCS